MNTSLDILQIENYTKEDLLKFINNLIHHDFEKLVFLLYRIDVAEEKIKNLLSNNHTTNVEELIANAIIERVMEKKISKEKYKQQNHISEEEKW
ncbi:MAG TPA: hypothetical protein PKG56_01835 [Chitinophagaceae bacterium]|nr:hypothetical protein [Chitinophagaceae bacterium]MCC6634714.1 hypothetical protein [Chitinophagaceae bacterium]HMZ45731.1 hypothetical protein [Chitinophagaceae bacterium]HNF29488.1 hypothetical protein [Chitinophagaceae bacterium]HNJ59002.1 hypothetical protein [Chitinophagaceae bacterium]